MSDLDDFDVDGPDQLESWTSSDRSDLGRWLRRLWRHLTRRAALIAACFAAIAAAFAALVDPTSAIGQVLLVIVGILASVIVLPDEPHRLWNVAAADLADTVPSSQLLSASREVALAVSLQAQSRIPRSLVTRSWDVALDDLTVMIADPSRAVRQLDYGIQVTPMDDGPPLVSTSISCMRFVPNAVDDLVWFSFCSSLEALGAEFVEHGNGCLSRELIDPRAGEDLEAWVDRIDGYVVDLAVDGQQRKRVRTEKIEGDDWRVVRAYFKAPGITQRYVPTGLTVEFHSEESQRRFPVKFTAYRVFGSTQVTFEVLDRRASVEVDEYISAVTRRVTVTPVRRSGASGFRVLAAADTVLPAGAGVVFTWNNPPTAT